MDRTTDILVHTLESLNGYIDTLRERSPNVSLPTISFPIATAVVSAPLIERQAAFSSTVNQLLQNIKHFEKKCIYLLASLDTRINALADKLK